MLKKTISFVVFCVILFSSFFMQIYAYEPIVEDSSVEAYFLYNFDYDIAMAQKNITNIISPASTVKMMVACIALESEIDRNQSITITSDMIKGISGRFMGLEVGDVLTFNDLLYATICGGYNDASQALAVAVSGSVDAFILRMNEKAQELNMGSTRYLNVTGINESGMQTTLYDIFKLAKYMSENDEFVDISSTKTYKISEKSNIALDTIKNRSTLFSSFRGISNFNTGSGSANEDCTVIYYNSNDLSLMCIVMNAKPFDADTYENYAEKYAKNLLQHAIYDYSLRTVWEAKKPVAYLPVKFSINKDDIPLYIESDLKIYIQDDILDNDELNFNTYIYGNELKAPLKNGEVVGELIVSKDGKHFTSAPLIVKKDVSKNGFLYVLELIRQYVTSRAFIASCVIFAILMTLYYMYKVDELNFMYRRRKFKKR